MDIPATMLVAIITKGRYDCGELSSVGEEGRRCGNQVLAVPCSMPSDAKKGVKALGSFSLIGEAGRE